MGIKWCKRCGEGLEANKRDGAWISTQSLGNPRCCVEDAAPTNYGQAPVGHLPKKGAA